MSMTTENTTPATTTELLTAILLELRKLNAGASAGGTGPAGGTVASDYELDGQYGNPEIKKDPPRWSGDSMVGRRFSQTSPDYLDTVAGFKDWSAAKDDAAGAVDDKGRPKSHWARKDASLARGWAKRLRDGFKPVASNGGSRYGASGHGASAKHTGSPDGYGDSVGGDIPF
jgi:hypothetical protein